MIPTTSGIYAITNTVNGKQYVGSALNLRHRWAGHLRQLRTMRHHNRHLQAAFKKYGEAAFTFTVLEECAPAHLLVREQHWIDARHTFTTGYNLRPRAESNLGWHPTSDQIAHAACAIRQRLSSVEERARMAARLQAVLSDAATRARFIDNLIAARCDPATEARRKVAAYEATQRPEYRAAMRDTVRARLDDPEYADRLLAQVRSLAADPDLVARRSASIRQTWQDPARCAAARERGRAYWADPAYRERVLTARREARARRQVAPTAEASE